MTSRLDETRANLKAILAASRDLPSDHDDALADLLLEELRSPSSRSRGPAPAVWDTRHAGPVPIAITLGSGTFLSVAAAAAAHATMHAFVVVLVLMIPFMGAVVQIGLIIRHRQWSGRRGY